MFDELAERSLMSPLAGTKHTYVRLAIIIYCQIFALFFQICINSEKEDNLLRYTQIFEKIFLEISVPFDFHHRISGIIG